MKLSIFSFFLFLSMIVVGCTKWDLDKVSIQTNDTENPPSTSPTPTPTPTPSPTPNPAPSPITNDLNKVFFSSNQIGYIAGNKVVLKTTNGGTTWSKIKESSTIEFTAVYFVDDNNGFVGGNDQTYTYLYVTSDGGGSWKQISKNAGANDPCKITEILYTNNTIFYLFNNYPNATQIYGFVFYSTDNGTNWIRLQPRNASGMQGLNCATQFNGTIIIGGASYWDGAGKFGGTQSILNLTNPSLTLSKIDISNSINGICLSNNKAIAVGDGGSFFNSLDKGTNWSTKTISGFINIDFHAVIIIDDLNFYIAGENGTLLKTSDGGLNWTQITTTGKYSLNGFSLKPNGELYLVGNSGQILKVK